MSKNKTMKPFATAWMIAGFMIVDALNPQAQAADVNVSVNVKHTVGGISTFDREKFSTIHATHNSGDWTTATLNDFVGGRDIYFGRDTGNWYMSQMVDEDSGKPGWPNAAGTDSIQGVGAWVRGSNDNLPYEERGLTAIRCEQFAPFWPGSGTNPNRYSWTGPANPWAYSTTDTAVEPFGSASGYAMGHYIHEFFGHAGNNHVGRPQPAYYEILNEPDYPLFDNPGDPLHGTASWEELFDYHNTVADQIRRIDTHVNIGGFCPSHPNLAENNFRQWNERYKLFLDMCATNMDFFSIHIYDIYDNGHIKKGSHLEATFDMIEHYGKMVKGEPLPFVVSEFGGRDRNLESYPTWRPLLWEPERDWVAIKSINSMLMSFADRPHLIAKTIPFIMLKEEWAYGTDGGSSGDQEYAHSWRLFRKENEPVSYTGDWVYTDYIHFYDLWKNVSGTRVDITTSDPDIQVDAYVDGDKAYVILNNLNEAPETVNLNLFEYHGNPVVSVREKNLYWNGSNTTLDETLHAGGVDQMILQPEGAAILEYTFADPVNVDHTSDEVKHYAGSYYQYIIGGFQNVFQINGVGKGAYGDAVLRLGFGRAGSLSKQPVVRINGTQVEVPTDFMGHEGDSRPTFFGQLNIPVPYALLQSNNSVSVTFPDSGGYISSVNLRSYAFSTDVRNGGPPPHAGSIFSAAEVSGAEVILSISNGIPDGTFDLMSSVDLTAPGSNWTARQFGLQFDSSGRVSVTNPVADVQEFFRIREPGTIVVPVDGLVVAPAASTLSAGQTVQLTATVSPGNASDPSVIWSSDAPAVAGVGAGGLVSAYAVGTAVITASSVDGGFTDTCVVTVPSAIEAAFDWDEHSGDWWTSYAYEETDNGVTMVCGGRTAAHDGGDGLGGDGFAFKAAYSQDSVDGTFSMEYGGSAVDFVVTAVDISGDSGNAGMPQGDLVVRGVLDGEEQWSIDPVEDGDFHAYTVATTGNMALEIDTILWSAPYDPANSQLIWGNAIDNLAVTVSP